MQVVLTQHLLIVQVAVDVGPEPTERLRVDGNVRQDNLVTVAVFLNDVRSNVVKVFQVVIDLEDVMITLDKNETTVQALQQVKVTSVHHQITEHVHPVLRINYGVVISDDSFVMLLNRGEGP